MPPVTEEATHEVCAVGTPLNLAYISVLLDEFLAAKKAKSVAKDRVTQLRWEVLFTGVREAIAKEKYLAFIKKTQHS